jgi:glycosyltransferase involved in cell wall biosynthesis
MSSAKPKVLFFANTDWYLANFRLGLAAHVRDQGCEVVIVSPPGPHGHRIEAAGFRWIKLPMARRSLNPIRELMLLWKLFRVYSAEKPDLVHNFTIKCVVYGGLVARLMGIKGNVASVDGLGFVFASSSALAQVLKPVVSELMRIGLGGNSSRVIVQNPDDFLAFKNAAMAAPHSIRLIVGSGVNTDHFCPRPDLPIWPRIRVLLASRLLWEKGLAEYVQAAEELKSRGYDAEFLIAGVPDPGNPGSVQVEEIEKWRAAGAVIPVGHIDDMAEFLRTVDIVVLPSFYREGVPRCLLEAASAGLPIVTTDMPGCRSAVDDGVTGFLIPPRDSRALANATAKLLDDASLRLRMGSAGRAKMLAEFDQRLVFDQTFALYRELSGDFTSSSIPCTQSPR